MKLYLRLYYLVKPVTPRFLRLAARRKRVRKQREKNAGLWPIDPQNRLAPHGWSGWPDGKDFALVLTHDVETARGQDKVKPLVHLEQEFGVRSSFNFVPERYQVSAELRQWLRDNGFEVGVHDYNHDGRLYDSRKLFIKRSQSINRYLREWDAKGFRSACMLRNLEWIGMLNIDYDASTFDTDPFEPQPDGVGTLFPFCVERAQGRPFVELPYTLAQDSTLFLLFREQTIDVWKTKLDWIVQHGGMALVNVHPDYLHFPGLRAGREHYSVERYREFLDYCSDRYAGRYWQALPEQVARLCLNKPVAAPPVEG